MEFEVGDGAEGAVAVAFSAVAAAAAEQSPVTFAKNVPDVSQSAITKHVWVEERAAKTMNVPCSLTEISFDWVEVVEAGRNVMLGSAAPSALGVAPE